MQKQIIVTVQSEARAISADMRELYENFKNKAIPREDADTLANISGKNLKAISILQTDQIHSEAMLRIRSTTQRLVESK